MDDARRLLIISLISLGFAVLSQIVIDPLVSLVLGNPASREGLSLAVWLTLLITLPAAALCLVTAFGAFVTYLRQRAANRSARTNKNASLWKRP
ncbi:MAG TPA: hypothetical protein VF572_03825 [Candidatus Saccharimonadales bacterium]|jgi:hypothetical protein